MTIEKPAPHEAFEKAIPQALKLWGPLGLMDLRRKVCGVLGWEVPLATIKAEVRWLEERGRVRVDVRTRGFLVSLAEAA